jgi:hypothetical protein
MKGCLFLWNYILSHSPGPEHDMTVNLHRTSKKEHAVYILWAFLLDYAKGSNHNLNMELDLQSLLGSMCIVQCAHARLLLVSQDRRRLFVSPWVHWTNLQNLQRRH